MNTDRLIMLSLAAAIGLACVTELRAQERESRSSRDSSRESRSSRDTSRDSSRDRREESPASLTTAPQGYTDRYAVLESRNVFLRDRSRPATSRPSNSSNSSSPTTRRSAEESLVLRGIAMEYDGFRAYVEDLNTGNTLRVSPGESLAHGQVTSVAIDAIEYAHDGKYLWVEVGRDFTGKMAAAPTPSYASSGSSTSPTSLPANVNLDDPSLTPEQRMRLRRQLLEQRGR